LSSSAQAASRCSPSGGPATLRRPAGAAAQAAGAASQGHRTPPLLGRVHAHAGGAGGSGHTLVLSSAAATAAAEPSYPAAMTKVEPRRRLRHCGAAHTPPAVHRAPGGAAVTAEGTPPAHV